MDAAHRSSLALASLTLIDTAALASLTAVLGYTDSPLWTIWTTWVGLVGGFFMGRARLTTSPILSFPLWGVTLAATSGFFGALYLFVAGYVDSVDAMLAISGRNANIFLLAVPLAFTLGATLGHWRSGSKATQTPSHQPTDAKPAPLVSVNGIAHIQLSVSDIEASRAFYRILLVETFGMTVQYDVAGFFYAIGARTGIALSSANGELLDRPFIQRAPGLHHLCFRARSRADVDRLMAIFETRLKPLGGGIVHGAEDGPWAPGYYSALFEDPDGIRLEINFVPGKGNLDTAVRLDPGNAART